MTTVIVIAVLAVVCAALALILHRYFPGCRMPVPFWAATALGGVILGVVIGIEFADAFARNPTEGLSAPIVQPLTVRLRHTLLAGDKVNSFQAEGWLNGDPPEIGSANEQIYVFDIWTDWCPVCREAAPGMVQSYEKFKDRGVQFVSISVMPEATAKSFIESNQVAWPTGYGASLENILEYGALDPLTTQAYNPMISNVEDAYVVPTIYVLRGDGTVLWSDGNSRYQHESLEAIAGKLDAAVESALAGLDESQTASVNPGQQP